MWHIYYQNTKDQWTYLMTTSDFYLMQEFKEKGYKVIRSKEA